MNPLTEQQLREKILTILRYPNGKTTPRNSIAEAIRHEQALKLIDLITQERKAWTEHVIGDDEPEPEIPVNDYYWRFRNELRAVQRQRNQEGSSNGKS